LGRNEQGFGQKRTGLDESARLQAPAQSTPGTAAKLPTRHDLGEAIMDDIPNYTNVQPVIQISEVRMQE